MTAGAGFLALFFGLGFGGTLCCRFGSRLSCGKLFGAGPGSLLRAIAGSRSLVNCIWSSVLAFGAGSRWGLEFDIGWSRWGVGRVLGCWGAGLVEFILRIRVGWAFIGAGSGILRSWGGFIAFGVGVGLRGGIFGLVDFWLRSAFGFLWIGLVFD